MGGRYTIRYSETKQPSATSYAFSDLLNVNLSDALFEKSTANLNLFLTRTRSSWTGRTLYRPRFDLAVSGEYYTLGTSYTNYRVHDALGNSVRNVVRRHTANLNLENLPRLYVSYSESSKKDTGSRKLDYRHRELSVGSEYRISSLTLRARGFRQKVRSVYAPGASFDLVGIDAGCRGGYTPREEVSIAGSYALFTVRREDYRGVSTRTRTNNVSMSLSAKPRERVLLGAAFSGRHVATGPLGQMVSTFERSLNFSASATPLKKTRVDVIRGYRFSTGAPGSSYSSLLVSHEQRIARKVNARASANRSWYWQEGVLERRADSGALWLDASLRPGITLTVSQAVSSTEPGGRAIYPAYSTLQTTAAIRAVVTYRLSVVFDYQSSSSGNRPSLWRPNTRTLTARADYLLTKDAKSSVTLFRTSGTLTSYNLTSTLTYAMGRRTNVSLNYSRRSEGVFGAWGEQRERTYDSGSAQMSTRLRGDVSLNAGYELSRLQDDCTYGRLNLELNKRF
jgi:hypothetical protein